jgi:hypothetical protein
MREMCALAFWGGNWNNVAVQKWGRRDKGNGTTHRGPHRQPLWPFAVLCVPMRKGTGAAGQQPTRLRGALPFWLSVRLGHAPGHACRSMDGSRVVGDMDNGKRREGRAHKKSC